jgi:hypothetical protein
VSEWNRNKTSILGHCAPETSRRAQKEHGRKLGATASFVITSPKTKRVSERQWKTDLDKVPPPTGNGRSVHADWPQCSGWRQSDPPRAALIPAGRRLRPCAAAPVIAFCSLGSIPASVE